MWLLINSRHQQGRVALKYSALDWCEYAVSCQNDFSLNIVSIFPAVFDLDGKSCVPITQDNVKKLVNDIGFPDRFFVNLVVGRRLSAHTTKRTGDCWTFCDARFSVATLQRTPNDDILSIVVYNDSQTCFDDVVKRYTSSKVYCRHPLLPILLVADAALEDYRNSLERTLVNASSVKSVSRLLDARVVHASTARLNAITFQRERLTRLSGDLKAFHASVRNLLSLHDGRNVDPGSLQCLSSQSGGQLVPIPSLGSMIPYLVHASGDILEVIPVIDTNFQNAFIIVRFRDGENRIPLFQH